MRRYLFITILLLAIALLIGCSSVVEAPAEEQSAEPTQEAVAQATLAEEAAPAATNTATQAVATETPAGQAEGAATQEVLAATAEPSPTPEPPTATASPQVNGQYEETYYRGLATAPITMIDYSDFL